MKLNKNKIIVSALGLVIGASLAGSVSGTIAWYQYSTRANVSFIGQAGGISSNLQMRFVSESDNDNAWRTQITWQQMNAELANGGFAQKIVPMTFGGIKKDAALPKDNEQKLEAYVQPQPGVGNMASWARAQNKNYAQFQLQLRNINREGAAAANDEQNVFLSKLLIQEDRQNGQKEDLSDAIRVHISTSAGFNRLISNQGKDVLTKGQLDLDGDGQPDQAYVNDDDGFGFAYNSSMDGDNTVYTRVEREVVVYGDDNDNSTDEIQTSYAASYDPAFGGVKWTPEEIAAAQDGDPAYGKTTDDWKVQPSDPSLVYSENNKLYDDGSKAADPVVANKSIGKTVAGNASYLTVTITIWVEGWQELDGSAIWDASKYVNSIFNVGIQFAVQDRQAE